jgi:uncharacterized protein YegP (UPF0339 family)
MYFQMYRTGNQWRWRLRAANHLIIADSGESYHNEIDCRHAVGLVMDTSRNTPFFNAPD